jgi:hypothetical protein
LRAGRLSQYLSGGFRSQAWLTALLREVTGIESVKPEDRPEIFASVAVMVDKAIGTVSTERLSLQSQRGGLALCTWPAELKRQAEATYRTDRARRILDFAAGLPEGWRAWPNVHLAYRFADIRQRLYLHHGFDYDGGTGEYIGRWQGGDFGHVGGHHHDHVRDGLWPWLLERGYANECDKRQLDVFLGRLGRRDAYLRPSIALQRTWSWKDTTDLEQRCALTGELRRAVAHVLNVLDEPLPPGCREPNP